MIIPEQYEITSEQRMSLWHDRPWFDESMKKLKEADPLDDMVLAYRLHIEWTLLHYGLIEFRDQPASAKK